MPQFNFYTAYRDTGIKTASGGKLLVMMYDEVIKQLNSALMKFNGEGKVAAGDIEGFGANIVKAQEVINELQTSLDMEKGEQIATNLMSLYIYFNKELMTVNVKKDREKLSFILDMISQLRDAWAAVVAKQPAAKTVDGPGLNITG